MKIDISIVYGQSMFPTIKNKDKLLIKKTPTKEIKKREIIIFQKDSQQICHRIIKIIKTKEGIEFYTRGDSNREIQEIDGRNILAKVVGVYRKGRLKPLLLENSFIYYLFINILSLSKEMLKKTIEAIYSFRFNRKIIKLLFPLSTDYFFIEDTEKDCDFRSFYNFYSFSPDRYAPCFGFIAKCKSIPVSKLWILKDKKGKYFLYGPYVKLLYRVRNIGTNSVKRAIDFLKNNNVPYLYAFSPFGAPLVGFLKKLAFSLEGKTEENFILFKLSLNSL